MRRSFLVAVALAGLVPAGATAATSDRAAARAGAMWLTRVQIDSAGQEADAIVALAANGLSRSSLRRRFDRLAPSASSYGRSAGGAAKIVLAAVAAGANPRAVAGVDYVARIRATYAAGRYGASTYDQAYAMLALRAAGVPVPRAAIVSVRDARGSGGWGYSLSRSARDDVTATALTIQAMRAAGVPARSSGIRAATAWMLTRRNHGGGLAIDGGNRPTETNSTAIAIRTLRAMGRTPPPAMVRQLRSLQEADGGWRFTAATRESRLLATIDASLALSGKGLLPPY